MIVGLGIDIQETESLKKEIKSKTFLKRVFSPEEIGYCESKPFPVLHYTARFAVKESAMKALGCGWDKGIQWRDIETVKPETGPPSILLHREAKALAHRMGVAQIHVSISHCDGYATAVVILEK